MIVTQTSRVPRIVAYYAEQKVTGGMGRVHALAESRIDAISRCLKKVGDTYKTTKAVK